MHQGIEEVAGVMKIVMVVYKFPQISETFIMRQTDYLNADVVTVEFDSTLGKKLDRIPKLVLSAEVPDPVLFFLKYYNKTRRRVFDSNYDTWHPKALKGFKNYIKDNQPDVVLAQFGPVGLNCMQICSQLGIPLVVHFHGYDASGLLRNKSYRYQLQKLFLKAQRLVVVNENMRQEFLRMGCENLKVSTIPCGVPIKEFDFPVNAANKETNFLFVGRLVPKKNPPALVEAFKLALQEEIDARLTIVGDGPLYNKTRKYVHSLDLGSKVEMPGAQTQETVKEYYRSADIFIQHSVTSKNGDTEGWPVAIAEAMASGLPVISTQHAGINDQVIHNHTGFLVPENDTTQMGKLMGKLAKDKKLCQRFGLNGRKRIQEIGNFTHQANLLRKVLSEAILDNREKTIISP